MAMINSATSKTTESQGDREIWKSLKQAIIASSGFQRWQEEKEITYPSTVGDLDAEVCHYLRKTLETLAY